MGLQKYCFINKTKYILIKSINGNLVNAKACVKIFDQLEEGISFVAIVQVVEGNKYTVLTDFNQSILEVQEGFNRINILKHKSVIKTLNQLKDEWNNYKIVN